MFTKFFRVALVVVIGLTCLSVTASASTISYLYKYDTVDGSGAPALQPSTNPSDSHADALHTLPYSTYGVGEMNDGWYAPEGIWDAGENYDPVGDPTDHNRYNFWDSNGGHQVGKNSTNSSQAKPSMVAKFDGAYDLNTIYFNYEVLLASGIRAPGANAPRVIKVYFGVDNGFGGISWSMPSDLGQFNDSNSDRYANYPWVTSNIWEDYFDVTTMIGSSNAEYVRLDITSAGEWISLIEIGFDGVAAGVPEPSTLAMLTMSALGLLCYAWRKRR